jgi:hypothetical protein
MVTYDDIIEAKNEAELSGKTVDHIVLTDEALDEMRSEDRILVSVPNSDGAFTMGGLHIETRDDITQSILVTEQGSQIPIGGGD